MLPPLHSTGPNRLKNVAVSLASRKITNWMFVEPTDVHGRYLCVLGCTEPDKSGLFNFAVTSTSSIHRHCERKHQDFLQKLALAKNNQYNIDQLEKEVLARKTLAEETLSKHKKHEAKFFRKINKGMTKKVVSNLRVTAWAIVNGISRAALNCVVFDSFLREVGSTPIANRHDLQAEYVPQLDRLVISELQARLKLTRSVSVTSDGWRDRRKCNWIDLGLAWTADSDDGKRGSSRWSTPT